MTKAFQPRIDDADLATAANRAGEAWNERLDYTQRRWQTLLYYVGIAATVTVASLLASWIPRSP